MSTLSRSVPFDKDDRMRRKGGNRTMDDDEFWKRQRKINLCIFLLGLIVGITIGGEFVLLLYH